MKIEQLSKMVEDRRGMPSWISRLLQPVSWQNTRYPEGLVVNPDAPAVSPIGGPQTPYQEYLRSGIVGSYGSISREDAELRWRAQELADRILQARPR